MRHIAVLYFSVVWVDGDKNADDKVGKLASHNLRNIGVLYFPVIWVWMIVRKMYMIKLGN